MEVTLGDVGGPHPNTWMALREKTGLPEEEKFFLETETSAPAWVSSLRACPEDFGLASMTNVRQERKDCFYCTGSLAKFRSSKSLVSSACPYLNMSTSQFSGSHYFLTNVLTLTKGPLIRGWKICLLCPSATCRIRRLFVFQMKSCSYRKKKVPSGHKKKHEITYADVDSGNSKPLIHHFLFPEFSSIVRNNQPNPLYSF